MSTSINLADPGVWDDRALIDSWNEALEEYKKYHSIHAQKKDLADVLTDEELVQLKMERRALRKGHPEPPKENNDNDDDVKMDISAGEDPSDAYAQPKSSSVNESTPPSNATCKSSDPLTAALTTTTTTQTMPQTLLNGVQDEGLRNLMMSWYYAGYYTGYHEGQQKAKTELNTSRGV